MTSKITTNERNIRSYEDHIWKNIETGDLRVEYSGQNQGKLDQVLLDQVAAQGLFKVYYRSKSGTPFTFVGETTVSSVIRERTLPLGQDTTNEERLCIRLQLPAHQVVMEELSEPEDDDTPHYKYKKQILEREYPYLHGTNNPASGFFY